MVYTPDLGSGAFGHAGSTPVFGTPGTQVPNLRRAGHQTESGSLGPVNALVPEKYMDTAQTRGFVGARPTWGTGARKQVVLSSEAGK